MRMYLQDIPVRVTFEPDNATVVDMGGGAGGGAMGGADQETDLYAIRFANSLTVLSSLQFLGSPGSIGFDDVEVVVIEDSDFR